MSLTGSGPDDPQRVGVPIADLLAGMYGAYGVLAALRERDRTGRGTVVRTSLLAATVGVHAFQGTRWTVAGEVGRAQGNHHPSIAPYGLFHCRDGAVQIAVGSEGLWRRLCAAFDLDPEAEGLATNGERVGARERVIEVVEAAFAEHDAEPLLALLAEAGVPAGKVRTLDEVYAVGADPQPGPDRRRRPRHPRAGAPARTAAAVLRPGRRGDHAARPRGPARARPARRRRPRLAGRGVSDPRPSAAELLDLVLDPGTRESWDEPVDPADLAGIDDDYRAALARAAERSGADESVLTGRGTVRGRPVVVRRQRVRLPRRLHRAGRRTPDHCGRTPGDGRGTARAGLDRVRRHPDAGGHPGLPADGGDRAGRHGPPRRGSALPRAPAAPHHRRRVRLLGLARPHHRGRARRAGRVPRPQGLRGPARRAVPRGGADRREPRRQGRHRRRRAGHRARRPRRPGARRPRRPADAGLPGPAHRPAGPSGSGVGLHRAHPRARPRRRPPPAAARRRVDAAAARHRRGRAGRDGRRRAHPPRRTAVRGGGPGPQPAGRRPPDGSGRPARGPAGDAAGRRAAAPARHRDRHPGRRAVGVGRGGRRRRRDRPLRRHPHHDDRAHGVGAPRAGLRGRSARPAPGPHRGGRRARLAHPAPARGGLGDRARRHRARRRGRRAAAGPRRPTSAPPAPSTGWCPSTTPTPPATSRSPSSPRWARRCATT